MREVTIQYSATGSDNPADWTTIYDGPIPITPAQTLAPVSLVIDFGGVLAKYVVITADNGIMQNWTNGLLDSTGLSEIQFTTSDFTCADALAEGYGITVDLNTDCRVDLEDLRIMASDWITLYTLPDFGQLSQDWLRCVDPVDPGCEHPWLP